jgi:hypothetical protein
MTMTILKNASAAASCFASALAERLYSHPLFALTAIGVVSLAIFLAAIPLPRIDGQLVGSDGIYYYMYVRSFWIDGDLDFENEYTHFYDRPGPIVPETGMRHNQYGIGCALLWSPFFLIAHTIAHVLNWLGIAAPLDGYSYLYQAMSLIGSIVYGYAGLLLSYKTATRIFSQKTALVATTGFCLASSFVYYVIVEPSMSHANASFVISLFIYTWYRTIRNRKAVEWGILGLIGALIITVRLPDGPYLIIPATESLFLFRSVLAHRDIRGMAKLLFYNTIFLLGLLVGLIPQILAWYAVYGSFVAIGYHQSIESGGFNWLAPKFFKVLFSSWHGLISWHPVYLFAIIGLIFLLRAKDRRLSMPLGAAFLANLYVLSSWNIWWQAAAFGSRKFIDGSIVFVIGLAAFLDRMEGRTHRYLPELAILALIVWNGLSMIQYRFGYVSLEEQLTFSEMVWDKLILPFRLAEQLLSR